MSSEDNQIASLFICRFQNLFEGIAYLNDDLGYEVDTGYAILFLHDLAERLKVVLNDLQRFLLLVLVYLARSGSKSSLGEGFDGV